MTAEEKVGFNITNINFENKLKWTAIEQKLFLLYLKKIIISKYFLQ